MRRDETRTGFSSSFTPSIVAFENVSEARQFSKRHIAKGNGYCTVLVWDKNHCRVDAMVYSSSRDDMGWAGITFRP